MLSIAIATYKRPKELKRLLETIPDYDWIQICVSNNSSPDNTTDVISCFNKKRINQVKYFVQAKNTGLNKNVINALSMCDNEHCLAMTDDDYFLPGIFPYIKKMLVADPNLSHFFSCINYYVVTNRAYVYRYKLDKDAKKMAATAIIRSHVHSGVIFRRNIIFETIVNHRAQIEGNIYVNFPFSAMAVSSGQFKVHEAPILIHNWENEVFWNSDPKSREIAVQYENSLDYIQENILSDKKIIQNLKNERRRLKSLIKRAARKIIRTLFFRML